MKALMYRGEGKVSIEDINEPVCVASDDIKVQVEYVGLCGTDAHIVSVPQRHPAANNIVLGHEFVGKVVEVSNSNQNLKIGDRVLAGPNIWCGTCERCKSGNRKFCLNNKAMGITIHGGWAEFVVGPSKSFYKVPDDVSSEEAIFAEPLSCVLNGFKKLGDIQGKRVAILGAGPIGCYFAKLFKYFGTHNITLCELSSLRRNFAMCLGFQETLEPKQFLQCQQKYDVVVDTTGFLVDQALDKLDVSGTALIFGLDQKAVNQIPPFDIARYEKRIIGCFIENDLIPACLVLLKYLKLGELITHRFRFENSLQALRAIQDIECMKAIIQVRA